MKRQICLHDRVVDYSVRRSKRAKRMRLAIYCDGKFIVTVPQATKNNYIEKYIVQKSRWVLSKLDFFKELGRLQIVKAGKGDFSKYKDQARDLVSTRILQFNNYYKFHFNKIVIKNQKTIWGSCSKKRNLNFNYKIARLPQYIRDYIIVHELCHLKEFNHSRKFWTLVSKTISNYDELRRGLVGLNVS